jgi:hypothetical protein
MALNVAMDGVSFPHRHEPANGLMAETGSRTMAKVDVLADLKQARAALSQNATYPADVALARNAIDRALSAAESVIAERDALLETLRRYQDGRVFSNLHTRQVARAISQEALAALAGASQ